MQVWVIYNQYKKLKSPESDAWSDIRHLVFGNFFNSLWFTFLIIEIHGVGVLVTCQDHRG